MAVVTFNLQLNVNPKIWNVKVIGINTPPFGSCDQPLTVYGSALLPPPYPGGLLCFNTFSVLCQQKSPPAGAPQTPENVDI